MTALALFLAALGVICLAMGLNPRKIWWKLGAWQYRGPEAVEPSDAASGMMRAFSIVAGLFCLVMAVILGVEAAHRQASILPDARAAASELQQKSKDGYYFNDRLSSDLITKVNGHTLQYERAPGND